MPKRRLVLTVSTLLVALLAAVAPTASAQTATELPGLPVTTWNQPGAEPLDGAGGWIYVTPNASPATTETYDYLLRFDLTGGDFRWLYIGLATRPQGPVAGMSIISNPGQPPILTPFNWVPGQFYYLLVYRSGPDQWIGWVYDHSAASWAIVGQLTAPEGSGLLSPISRTTVEGGGGYGVPCVEGRQTDVFFYPPVGYRGTTVTLATLGSHSVLSGSCPSTASIEYDWLHYRLGTAPAA